MAARELCHNWAAVLSIDGNTMFRGACSTFIRQKSRNEDELMFARIRGVGGIATDCFSDLINVSTDMQHQKSFLSVMSA